MKKILAGSPGHASATVFACSGKQGEKYAYAQ